MHIIRVVMWSVGRR